MIDLSLHVCFGGDTCEINVVIFNNVQVPIPGCNMEQGFQIPGKSFWSFMLTYYTFFCLSLNSVQGARCSSMVRAFAHGVMGGRIDPSWWTH